MHSQQRMNKRTHQSAIGAVTLPPAPRRGSLRSALRRGCAPPTAAAGVVSSPRGSSALTLPYHAPIGHSRLLLPRLSPPTPGPALHCGACSRGCRDYNPQGPARPPVGSGQRLVCGNRGRRFLLAGASGAASGALEGSGGGEVRAGEGLGFAAGLYCRLSLPAVCPRGSERVGRAGGPVSVLAQGLARPLGLRRLKLFPVPGPGGGRTGRGRERRGLRDLPPQVSAASGLAVRGRRRVSLPVPPSQGTVRRCFLSPQGGGAAGRGLVLLPALPGRGNGRGGCPA